MESERLDYGYRIIAIRNNGRWTIHHNGNEIGIYSSIFLADQVACAIRRACSGIRVSDLRSDWWKN